MNFRAAAVTSLLALMVGCTSGGSGGTGGEGGGVPTTSPAALTVSYRNKVRVPSGGTAMDAPTFASQVRTRDPIASARCAAEELPAYRDITSFLGGISWSHPVAIVKDASYPPLYSGKRDFSNYRMSGSSGASDAASPGPTIERPDLIGVRDGIGVFLSQQHGLLAVDARGPSPVLSCAMKLPGEPKNFLFHGSELVVVVNSHDNRSSALLRYSVAGGTFHFVDAVPLQDQTIVDARAFDSTIVLYTSWNRPRTTPAGGTNTGGGDRGGMAAPSYGYASSQRFGSKMLVVQWDEALAVDWEDSLLDDAQKQDPTEGNAPDKTYALDEVVSQQKTYAGFVAASDRYVVVPRSVQTTTFAGYQSTSYQVCTSYNPKYEQVQSCSVRYERRTNPDYRAPGPTGDYACNGKKLADCIQEAAPVVSQYVYVPVGKDCAPVWIGRCEKYETRTNTYPTFKTKSQTELTIYRFENGSFTKLDSTLARLVEKPNAIAFETKPLVLDGTVTSRNQLQFQNGQFYAFINGGLETMAVAGSSVSYVHRLDIHSNTDSDAAIAFSDKRAMISAGSYSNASQVTMLDLSVPSAPAPLTAFQMPGTSTQLFMATGGIFGPGSVGLGNDVNARTLQKLTLFSNDNGNELDNLLLGTEYDTFTSSWIASNDDQRIRLGSNGTRIFVPYSGRHHADETEPTAHRLAIARIENARLVSEKSFNVNDEIIRTAAIDDARSLVFGDSASYVIDRTSGDWQLTTLKELYVPFATYRLADDDMYARIARVGTKCRITTHAGDAQIFGEQTLGSIDVGCNEGVTPTAFGRALFFSYTLTGARIGDDGRTLTALTAAEVKDLIAKTTATSKDYCWIAGQADTSGSPVDALDAIPAQILCAPAQ